MKNAYALKLAAQRTAREVQAHQDGAQFALNLCAVALNNVYGFGRERLERLEREVNRLLEDEAPVLAYYGFFRENDDLGARFIGTLTFFVFDKNPHWQHESTGLFVTHWMPLPEPPK